MTPIQEEIIKSLSNDPLRNYTNDIVTTFSAIYTSYSAIHPDSHNQNFELIKKAIISLEGVEPLEGLDGQVSIPSTYFNK